MKILNKSSLLILLVVIFTLSSSLVFAEENNATCEENCPLSGGPKCFSQDQINCFFLNLSPFLALFVVVTVLGFLRFEKKILKLKNWQKVLIVCGLLIILYVTMFVLVKFFFYIPCSG